MHNLWTIKKTKNHSIMLTEGKINHKFTNVFFWRIMTAVANGQMQLHRTDRLLK